MTASLDCGTPEGDQTALAVRVGDRIAIKTFPFGSALLESEIAGWEDLLAVGLG